MAGKVFRKKWKLRYAQIILQFIITLIFKHKNFVLQLCPDQPCGATTAIGNGVTLGAAGANGVLPCIAFSVGVDANEANAIAGDLCQGDLIRINGMDYFSQVVS